MAADPQAYPQKPILQEALRLSWPATLALLLHSLYRVSDQYWIQDLGPPAQAALGLSSFMLIFNFAFISLFYSGCLARVARAVGSGNRSALERAYRTALSFGGLWFLLLAAVGYASSDFWVKALGAQGEVGDLASTYLAWIYLGLPAIGFKPVLDGVFIGLGNTKAPMYLSGLSVGLNFLLNPILIYGWGPIPALGVAGAAIATIISRALSCGLALILLARLHGLRWRGEVSPTREEAGQQLKIGLPMAISTAGYSGVFILVLKTTLEPFGETVQAGLGVAFNGVEALSYCGLMGPAVAVAGMVGRELGAGRPQRAKQAVHACGILSGIVALCFSLMFLAIPEVLTSFYTSVAEVQTEAVRYLVIVAWSQLAVSAYSVMEQALAGAGKTRAVSMISLGGNALRIPLCWALAHPLGWGPAGAWWAMNVSNLMKFTAIAAVLRSGRWLQESPPQARSPHD